MTDASSSSLIIHTDVAPSVDGPISSPSTAAAATSGLTSPNSKRIILIRKSVIDTKTNSNPISPTAQAMPIQPHTDGQQQLDGSPKTTNGSHGPTVDHRPDHLQVLDITSDPIPTHSIDASNNLSSNENTTTSVTETAASTALSPAKRYTLAKKGSHVAAPADSPVASQPTAVDRVPSALIFSSSTAVETDPSAQLLPINEANVTSSTIHESPPSTSHAVPAVSDTPSVGPVGEKKIYLMRRKSNVGPMESAAPLNTTAAPAISDASSPTSATVTTQIETPSIIPNVTSIASNNVTPVNPITDSAPTLPVAVPDSDLVVTVAPIETNNTIIPSTAVASTDATPTVSVEPLTIASPLLPAVSETSSTPSPQASTLVESTPVETITLPPPVVEVKASPIVTTPLSTTATTLSTQPTVEVSTALPVSKPISAPVPSTVTASSASSSLPISKPIASSTATTSNSTLKVQTVNPKDTLATPLTPQKGDLVTPLTPVSPLTPTPAKTPVNTSTVKIQTTSTPAAALIAPVPINAFTTPVKDTSSASPGHASTLSDDSSRRRSLVNQPLPAVHSRRSSLNVSDGGLGDGSTLFTPAAIAAMSSALADRSSRRSSLNKSNALPPIQTHSPSASVDVPAATVAAFNTTPTHAGGNLNARREQLSLESPSGLPPTSPLTPNQERLGSPSQQQPLSAGHGRRVSQVRNDTAGGSRRNATPPTNARNDRLGTPGTGRTKTPLQGDRAKTPGSTVGTTRRMLAPIPTPQLTGTEAMLQFTHVPNSILSGEASNVVYPSSRRPWLLALSPGILLLVAAIIILFVGPDAGYSNLNPNSDNVVLVGLILQGVGLLIFLIVAILIWKFNSPFKKFIGSTFQLALTCIMLGTAAFIQSSTTSDMGTIWHTTLVGVFQLELLACIWLLIVFVVWLYNAPERSTRAVLLVLDSIDLSSLSRDVRTLKGMNTELIQTIANGRLGTADQQQQNIVGASNGEIRPTSSGGGLLRPGLAVTIENLPDYALGTYDDALAHVRPGSSAGLGNLTGSIKTTGVIGNASRRSIVDGSSIGLGDPKKKKKDRSSGNYSSTGLSPQQISSMIANLATSSATLVQGTSSAVKAPENFPKSDNFAVTARPSRGSLDGLAMKSLMAANLELTQKLKEMESPSNASPNYQRASSRPNTSGRVADGESKQAGPTFRGVGI